MAGEVCPLPEEPWMERPSPPAAQAWADDDELAGEIELYGDLVVAASSQEEPMTPLEIDNALGLDDDADATADGPPAH